MTCIVGIKTDDAVHIGSDSAGVSGGLVEIRRDSKVFSLGEFIFGFTSSFRMGQLIQYRFTPPTPPQEAEQVFAYMATDFVDAVRKVFEEYGYMGKDDTGREEGGTFMVGYKNRLFEVHSDFQVAEFVMNFASVGCGSPYALGSLYWSGHLMPKERIYMALEAAEFFSAGVRGPFKCVSTGGKA